MLDPLPRFADTLERTFERASGRADSSERDIRLGGRGLRLAFAGDGMRERVMPAFEHLAGTVTEVDLAIRIWDARSSGTSSPLPEGADGRERYHAENERFDLHLDPEGRSSLVDRSARLAWFWTADADTVPLHERATPLRKVIQGWAAERGMQLVHGAAVGTARGGVLLVGGGGTGKSTAALACYGSELRYAADDYCLVELARDEASVHSLYCTGKLREDSLRLLPGLARHVVNRERAAGDKAMLLFAEAMGERLIRHLPLVAILIPRVAPERPVASRIHPASPADALRALAPSTVLQLRQGGDHSARTIATIASLVRRRPTFRFDVGTDPAGIQRAIRDLLAELGAA